MRPVRTINEALAGGDRTRVRACVLDDASYDCDLVCMCPGFMPAYQLPAQAGGRSPSTKKLTHEVNVMLEAPRRGVNHLGLLKGSFSVVGPSKMLYFTFDRLVKVPKQTPVAKMPSQTRDGVTVHHRRTFHWVKLSLDGQLVLALGEEDPPTH